MKPSDRSLVMKFSGSSVAGPRAIERVTNIVAESLKTRAHPPVLVVTALYGVTDHLRASALHAAWGDYDQIPHIAGQRWETHREAAADLERRELGASKRTCALLSIAKLRSAAAWLAATGYARPSLTRRWASANC